MSKSFSKRELDAIDLGWDSECAKPFEIDLAALDAGWDVPIAPVVHSYIRQLTVARPDSKPLVLACLDAGWDLPIPRYGYTQPFVLCPGFTKPRRPAALVVPAEKYFGAENFECPERPMIDDEN